MSLIESYRGAERQDIGANRRTCFKIQQMQKKGRNKRRLSKRKLTNIYLNTPEIIMEKRKKIFAFFNI